MVWLEKATGAKLDVGVVSRAKELVSFRCFVLCGARGKRVYKMSNTKTKILGSVKSHFANDLQLFDAKLTIIEILFNSALYQGFPTISLLAYNLCQSEWIQTGPSDYGVDEKA